MPSINDYVEEAQYNLRRTVSDIQSALNLLEDEEDEEMSDQAWDLEDALKQLEKAGELLKKKASAAT